MFCKYCGSEIDGDSSFCTSCGASINNADSSEFYEGTEYDPEEDMMDFTENDSFETVSSADYDAPLEIEEKPNKLRTVLNTILFFLFVILFFLIGLRIPEIIDTIFQ